MFIKQETLDITSTYQTAMSHTGHLLKDYPWENKLFYAMWLSQIYYFVCEATRLIPFAAAHFKKEDAAFHARCVNHAQEEMGHEELARTDIEKLGFSLDMFSELIETQQFYQNQYYMIQNHDPMALFGINIYMEGLSRNIGREVTARLIKAHGRDACSFMHDHTNEDEAHLAEAFSFVDKCPPMRRKVILLSLQLAQINFEAINKKVFTLFKELEAQQAVTPTTKPSYEASQA